MTRIPTRCVIFSALLIALLPNTATAVVYQYTDDSGTHQLVTDPSHVPPRFQNDMVILDDDQTEREYRAVDAPTIDRTLGNLAADGSKIGTTVERTDQIARALQDIELDPPSTWNDYAMLAGGLILLIFALRMFHGILRLAALVCGLSAIGMFIVDQFPETGVAKGLSAVGKTVAAPIAAVHSKVAEKVGKTATAPMEAVKRVKGAVDRSNENAEERIRILEQLGADN
jgi:hypothetical protein